MLPQANDRPLDERVRDAERGYAQGCRNIRTLNVPLSGPISGGNHNVVILINPLHSGSHLEARVYLPGRDLVEPLLAECPLAIMFVGSGGRVTVDLHHAGTNVLATDPFTLPQGHYSVHAVEKTGERRYTPLFA